MSKISGGGTARNPRQGFRSEYIARYIFSAFGTAVEVSQGNDIGIDLLCNLTSNAGMLILYKSSFGVQIKSEGTDFQYKGKQATTWLSKLEFPLLFASVDKANSRIKIYSAWSINKYLLSLHSYDENKFPDEIKFITSEVGKLDPPSADGIIPIGKPILDFYFNDINDPNKSEKYHKVLEEWLDIDNENYKLRRAGVSRTYGFTEWETNKPPSESNRVWDIAYYYSEFHTDQTQKLLAEGLVSLAVFYMNNYEGSKSEYFREEFNKLKIFADSYLSKHIDEFGKGIFQTEL